MYMAGKYRKKVHYLSLLVPVAQENDIGKESFIH